MKTYDEHLQSLQPFFESQKLEKWITNIHGSYRWYGDENHPLIAITPTNDNPSYVLSAWSTLIAYPLEELAQKPSPTTYERQLLSSFGKVAKFFHLDRCAVIGSFPFSTNFYPSSFPTRVKDSLASLTSTYFDHYLMIRSLNSRYDKNLIETFQKEGWIVFPVRKVYLFPYTSSSIRRKKNHIKNDRKLLTSLPETENFSDEDYETMVDLYRQLFIDKHSQLNPQITPQFLKLCITQGLLGCYAYRDQGHIHAFITSFECEGYLSTPILGYDTHAPQEWGLYRKLFMTLLEEGEKRGMDVNFSSGAAHFKQQRGGEGVWEYSAFYAQHLSRGRKLFLTILGKILSVVLMKYGEKWGL